MVSLSFIVSIEALGIPGSGYTVILATYPEPVVTDW